MIKISSIHSSVLLNVLYLLRKLITILQISHVISVYPNLFNKFNNELVFMLDLYTGWRITLSLWWYIAKTIVFFPEVNWIISNFIDYIHRSMLYLLQIIWYHFNKKASTLNKHTVRNFATSSAHAVFPCMHHFKCCDIVFAQTSFFLSK